MVSRACLSYSEGQEILEENARIVRYDHIRHFVLIVHGLQERKDRKRMHLSGAVYLQISKKTLRFLCRLLGHSDPLPKVHGLTVEPHVCEAQGACEDN